MTENYTRKDIDRQVELYARAVRREVGEGAEVTLSVEGRTYRLECNGYEVDSITGTRNQAWEWLFAIRRSLDVLDYARGPKK